MPTEYASGMPKEYHSGCMHANVPECDPITREEFHEREDHAHLLKVINNYKCNNSSTAN